MGKAGDCKVREMESFSEKIVLNSCDGYPCEELAIKLYKQYINGEITFEEYFIQAEKLFRDYLKVEPNHVRCKQELANLLQKRFSNAHLTINEQENLYRELILLSPLPRFKEGLARIIYRQQVNKIPLEELNKKLATNLFPDMYEIMDRFLNEDNIELQNLPNDILDNFEIFLRILIKITPSQRLYKRRLAQAIYCKALKIEESSTVCLQQLYEGLKELYRECIQLDSETELYQIEWLNQLNRMEQELSNEEQIEEVVNKRVEINFEIFRYDLISGEIKTRLEKLLLRQEEVIYHKQDEGLLNKSEATNQLEAVFSNLIKVDPKNSTYKYSLGRLRMDRVKDRLVRGRSFKGDNQIDRAYCLFQEVLEIDPNNFDALLKMANIHILKSEWSKAYNLLSSLLNSFENIRGTDSEIEFCLIYAATNAYVNRPEEAKRWLDKGIELDSGNQFVEQIFSARVHVNMGSNIKYYTVHHINKEKKMIGSTEIDQIIHEYEDNRLTSKQSKTFFDFRDMDSPKIIGSKRTIIIAEDRVKFLEYLLESSEPKSLKQINQDCFSGSKSYDNMKNLLANIRRDLDKVFSSFKENEIEYESVKKLVRKEVLITTDSKYQWVFKGETYLIKIVN